MWLKRKKIEEETKVLGKLMPQHFGSAESNEYLKLELSGTLVPLDSWGS